MSCSRLSWFFIATSMSANRRRMASAAGQPAKPDQFSKVKKSIARVKTALSQQRLGGKV